MYIFSNYRSGEMQWRRAKCARFHRNGFNKTITRVRESNIHGMFGEPLSPKIQNAPCSSVNFPIIVPKRKLVIVVNGPIHITLDCTIRRFRVSKTKRKFEIFLRIRRS